MPGSQYQQSNATQSNTSIRDEILDEDPNIFTQSEREQIASATAQDSTPTAAEDNQDIRLMPSERQVE
ncbi:hypothetical protein IAR50_005753 [Cryptococcus sp. DSM 104548]